MNKEIVIDTQLNTILFGNTKYYDVPKEILSYIEQLENNRDKAIEYLKEKADYPISYYHCIRETIDILKGGSDEQR